LKERADDVAKIRFPSLTIPLTPRGCFEIYFKRVRALEDKDKRRKTRIKKSIKGLPDPTPYALGQHPASH
jgi:hypothetical protein